MGELMDKLGNKGAGQLIRSEDWNALVMAVDGLIAKITTVENTLTDQVNGISTAFGQLKGEFDAFRSQTEPLLREYFRVTMETTKLNYALGELAMITARVTDLLGNPLDLTDVANRPWIDFVAMWGQIRVAPGFISRDNAGDRTLSVQVNEAGVASVQLHADHAEGFSKEDEDEIAGSLTALLPDRGVRVVDAILDAKSPVEAKQIGAFHFLSQEYDRLDTAKMRSYTDAYYLKYPTLVTGKVGPNLTQGWRDYHALVLAFARGDDNPQTPDQSRGVSSIQVTFRDWISPWVLLDYLPETNDLRNNLRLELGNQIHGNYQESIGRINEHVTEFVKDKGVLGKLRGYGVVYDAMAQLPVIAEPPDYFDDLIDNTRSAVSFQQAMGIAQANTAGFADQEVALKIFTGISTRAERKLGAVEGSVGHIGSLVDDKLSQANEQLTGLLNSAKQDFQAQVAVAATSFASQVDEKTKSFDTRFIQVEKTIQDQNQLLLENFRQVNDKSSQLENSVSSLNGRFSETLAEGGFVQQINARVNNVEGQLGALNVLDLNADELRQGAQKANLLWSIAQGNRGMLAIEQPVGDGAPNKP